MRASGCRRFGWYVWDQGPGLPGDWNGRLAPSHEFIFHFNRAPRKPHKTVALALRAKGFEVDVYDGFLTVSSKDGAVDVRATLHGIAAGEPANLFGDQTNLIFEKFHTYLSRDLLERDALACKLDANCLPTLCQKIVSH